MYPSEQKANKEKEKEVVEAYMGVGVGGSGYHRSHKKHCSRCRAVWRNVWNPQLGLQRGSKEGMWLPACPCLGADGLRPLPPLKTGAG